MKTETAVVVETGKELTAHERQVFAQCEEAIQSHFETYREAGAALLQIRELRLYREKFVSFDEYCRMKWDMTKTQANRLIAASRTSEDLVKTLPQSKDVVEHLTESAMRPLVLLKPNQAARVLKRVIRESPTTTGITAAHITQVAKEVAPAVFAKRGTKPGNHKDGRISSGDLIRRSELIAGINKWAKTHNLAKISAAQTVKAIKQLIREL